MLANLVIFGCRSYEYKRKLKPAGLIFCRNLADKQGLRLHHLEPKARNFYTI